MELGTAGALESAATRTDEVAVLTTEPGLLDSLRDAAPQLVLVGAGSIGELARLLGTHPCRALAVDFATIGNGGIAMMERLAALFPELPLVVIGTPADEPFVTPLLDRAVVWRFLAKPPVPDSAATVLAEAARVGRQRALGVDTADDEEEDLDDDGDEILDEDPDADDEDEAADEDEDEDPPRSAALASLRRIRDTRRPVPAAIPGSSPAPPGSPPPRREPPVRRWPTAARAAPSTASTAPGGATGLDAASASAAAGTPSTGGTGAPGATGALGARPRRPLGRPATSKATWAAVGGATLIGVLALALLSRDRAPTAPAAPAASTGAERGGDARASTVERAPPGVATLVAAGDLALARGALVAPLGTSAIDYYRRAVSLDPGNDAARTGLTAVTDALLRDADAALVDGRLAEAESAVRAAALAGPDDPRVAALLARVRDADTRGEARAAGRVSPARAGAAPTRSGGSAPRVAPATGLAAPASGGAPDASAAAPGGAEPRGAGTARSTGANAPQSSGAAGAPTAESSAADRRTSAAESTASTSPDDAATARGATGASGRGPDAPDVPLQRVSGAAPVFPQRARENGVEGWVDVEFTVDTRGVPGDIHVQPGRRASDRKLALRAPDRAEVRPDAREVRGRRIGVVRGAPPVRPPAPTARSARPA
jgi:hypothetical protein